MVLEHLLTRQRSLPGGVVQHLQVDLIGHFLGGVVQCSKQDVPSDQLLIRFEDLVSLRIVAALRSAGFTDLEIRA